MRGRLIATAVVFLSVAAISSADPPRVIRAEPDNGATGVSPSTDQIRVAFDQAMDTGGASFAGGGPLFPKTTGAPKWLDDRTCILPVRLEPNRDYRLSVNSERFRNFRSKAGEPAVPYLIIFSTGGTGPTSRPALTPARNKPAIAALRKAIDTQYSHRDHRKLDWDKLFNEFSPRLESATSAMQFAAITGQLLEQTRDIHIWLTVDGTIVSAFRRAVDPNFNGRTLQKIVPNWGRRGPVVFTGRFEDGIGYMLISSWSANSPDAFSPLYDALKNLADAKGLVIDVRPNSGGDERIAGTFAGCFIEKRTAYAKNITIKDGKWSEQYTRSIGPNTPAYRGKVAVLMGPVCMSSCEAFLMMMKQAPNAKLIGAKSYGASGNPQPHDLGNGVTVMLPCWKDQRLDGTCFEGEGIAPDIEVKTTTEDFAKADPVIEAALKYLRGE